MLSLKIILVFCETTICWEKCRLLNSSISMRLAKKIDRAKANIHVVLYYKKCSKKKQWNNKQ